MHFPHNSLGPEGRQRLPGYLINAQAPAPPQALTTAHAAPAAVWLLDSGVAGLAALRRRHA